MDLNTVQAAFASELEKIAEETKKPKKPQAPGLGSAGLATLIGLAGGEPIGQAIPGALGAGQGLLKGAPHGEMLQGAARGFGGGVGGALAGELGGGMLGSGVGYPGLGKLLGGAAGGYGGYRLLTSKYDDAPKTAAELTPEARSHIKGKNFAVSAKASNTGKPAYPIPDKAHARAALGFAAMHHDKKDLAEVRKDVERKFPGMVKEKKGGIDPSMFKVATFNLKKALESGVAEAGPALGATLGAGLAGGLGKNPLSGAALGYGAGSLPEIFLGKKHAPAA